MSIKKLVRALPYPLERSLCSVYGAIPPRIRYGKTFRQMYAFLQDSQWWSRERLEEYQMQHLGKLTDRGKRALELVRDRGHEVRLHASQLELMAHRANGEGQPEEENARDEQKRCSRL